MKRLIAMLMCLISIQSGAASQASAENVDVAIPEFNVTVNGQAMSNIGNEYPLLVYKDITYFPLAQNYTGFLGVKVNWHERRDGVNVLFVGISDEAPLQTLKTYPQITKPGSLSASVPGYHIAVNTVDSNEFVNNDEETYPFLNFRGITYIPLTWQCAVDELGWEYSWDAGTGLSITSKEPFRPVIDDSYISATLPGLGQTYYCYGEEYYVGYPGSTFSERPWIVKKRGGAETEFDLNGQLAGQGDYSFNQRLDTNGPGKPANPVSDIKPSIDGTVFSIVCIRADGEGLQSVMLKIDIETGKIIEEEEIPPRIV